jgi:hypothetical protein
LICNRLRAALAGLKSTTRGDLEVSNTSKTDAGTDAAASSGDAPADAKISTYSGGCHCGKVRFEAVTDLAKVVACNCSICTKRATLWSFVAPERFTLLAGGDALTDYQFNKHVIHHLFCSTCGILSFARGTLGQGQEMIALNVRCLDGIDLDALTIGTFDGRSL